MNKLTPGSNLRWESSRMILPEHREQWLRYRSSQQKSAPPLLDEQRWAEMEWTLRQAMEEGAPLTFTYWEEGEIREQRGMCYFIDHTLGRFHVQAADDERYYLPFSVIVDIEAG
ncbi:YolD-like family protein [Salicibibacter halophilus]|uniref:YolD-like family protein n=1 Tax=Salicibibacter halophilus TaxID=2502791 RepID=A0A514LK75_9BACI|nr:YolD-like family protein [Salicibibacter halophilus]QDI92266.1 YolD-like family protein [Salicibibacter halophilus]